MLGSLANVCYHSYSWELGRPPKPHIIIKACGRLAASQVLLFRYCLCCPIKQWCLLTFFVCLPSHHLSLGDGRVYQGKRQRQWLFLPLLSWLSIVLASCIHPYSLIIKYISCKAVLCLVQDTFFFLGETIVKLTWWLASKASMQHRVQLTSIFLWKGDSKFISKIPWTAHWGHYHLPSALFPSYKPLCVFASENN